MKIKKFNENTQHGIWNKNRLLKISRKKKEIKKEEEDFLTFISDYLVLNPTITQPRFTEDSYVDSYEYIEALPDMLFFKFIDPENSDQSENASFDQKEFNDFLKYLDNPELYKTSKKYNLR